MYKLEISEKLRKIFVKLRKKNSKQLVIIANKSEEILANPKHYKNLRKPMQHLRRVHVDRHFVLVFSVNEQTKTVWLENYDHHDNIYN